MTNNAKNRPNTMQHQHRTSASASATSSTSAATIEDLREQNKELQRLVQKYKGTQKTMKTTVKQIIRPKGEAGSRRRGFILYDAMGLHKMENGPVMYDRMRDSVRKACIRVGLDLGGHYRHQDPEKLGQVFHLVRNTFPYLTTDRFPHNWAVAEMVKGYIAGTRKARKFQTHEDEESRGFRSKSKRRRECEMSELDDDPPSTKPKRPQTSDSNFYASEPEEVASVTSGKNVAHSGNKPKRPHTSDSDFYASEPEEVASITSGKNVAHSGNKPKRPRTNDSDFYVSRPKEVASVTSGKNVTHSGNKPKGALSQTSMMKTTSKRNTRDMSNDHGNEDDDEDFIPEHPPKKRRMQTRQSKRSSLNSGEKQSLPKRTSSECDPRSGVDDGNKDDGDSFDHDDDNDLDHDNDYDFEPEPPLEISSQSRP
ncbi:hypothetical protein M413DRAFT_29912 [Hebeloma cylindrosporum]|uniref:Uncharacterized protein n=1 Tax=Hebeloma cylindrosporum TaxID=76867 RepID=A0A0C2XLR9_HEBCY|nr:hypothetical protein M413DRAFT_29912 [Hebeloma cylindrosporum h7]